MSDHRLSPDTAYTSDLPLEHVERIRRWHEKGLRAARGGQHQRPDLRLPGSHALCAASRAADLRHVSPARRGVPCRGATGRPGAGHGYRLRGQWHSCRAGADVLALDVNPEAVQAAQDNARRNGVADRLEVRLSDVFDAVEPAAEGPFDVVVFDSPFRWF